MIRSTKIILITLFILAGILLNAVSDKYYYSDQEIKLEFDNIKIKDIDFYNGDEIIVNHTKKDDVQIEQLDNILAVSSKYEAKIALKLPATKTYTFIKDNANCYFSVDTMIIDTGDEIVKFTEDQLEVIEGDKTKVVIGRDGILVDDDNERVEIGSQGIIVEGDDNTELTGFWGQLLGGFIKAIVRTSISFAGKRPEKIAKYIINDDGDNSFSYSFGMNNNEEYNITEIFEEDYYLAANTTLTLDNINGGITVNRWNKDEMHLKITKKSFAEAEFDKMQIVIEEGKNFVVRTEHLEKRPRVSVQYEIDLPASVDLADVITSNGSIKLTGTSGDASVIASNGSIEVKDHTGDINARTSNGKIEADNLEGSIEAATSNGRIDLEGIAGSASANTSNGSIDISGCKLITEARTSNARIELEIVEMNDDLDVVTSNGKVILEISAHLNADLTASTNNSKIIWDHPRLNTEIVKNNYVKGKLGAGGYHLDIRTSNANIYLETLEELF